MAQQFIPTPGGNIYPDPDTSYDQSEAFRQVALNRDILDGSLRVFHGPAGTVFPVNNLDTMASGFVTVGDHVNATALGLPEAYGGWVLHVNHNATGANQLYVTSHQDGAHIWTRNKGGGVWGSWRRVDAGRPPRLLPLNADLNTYYGDEFIGSWRVTSTVSATNILNLPLDSLGRKTTTVVDVTGPYGFQTARVYNATSAPLIYYRARTTPSSADVNAWTEWVSLTSPSGGSGGSFANVMQDNKAHVDAFMRAKGGSIGTGGLASVALRFDHNLANFRDIILPLLRARNLPWSLAVNTSQNHIDAPANGGVTWAQIQGWALSDGGEVLAHSHNHADSTTDEAIIANVEDSIPILKAGMPQLVVEGFAIPGAGGTNWNGFLDTTTPEHFTTKYAGASAVLRNFAFCTGYITGALRPQSGQLTNGQTHITMDNTTSASSVTYILQQAQEMGAAVQLMMHPNMLTLTDRITPAVLTQILDWIVTERDAGRLVVLTTSGLLLADAGSVRRDNILRPFGTAVWSNTTGWTVSGNTATGTGSAGIMAGSISMANLGHVRGRTRELVVEARATTESVLRLGVTGDSSLAATRSITLPADNAWRAYRIPFTIPATGTSMSVQLGRVSGGGAQVRNPAIQAV